MALLWSKTDQQAIKPVSINLIDIKFTQLATEVQAVELRKLLGNEFYNAIIEAPENYEDLINGTTYTYNNVTNEVKGVKYLLSNYFYARYISESLVQDSFSGMVAKNFDDSTRLSSGAIKNLQSEATTVAAAYWHEFVGLMNNDSANYPYWCCTKSNKSLKYRVL